METTERKTSELNINQEKLFKLKAERQRWKLKLTEPHGCARQYQNVYHVCNRSHGGEAGKNGVREEFGPTTAENFPTSIKDIGL